MLGRGVALDIDGVAPAPVAVEGFIEAGYGFFA